EMAAIAVELKLLRQQVSDLDFLEKALMGAQQRGELMGNCVAAFLLAAFDKVQCVAHRCAQEQKNLELAFTLAAYHRDHGRYPSKLEDLAPQYLATIPGDLFSAEPQMYRLEGKRYSLYSLG